MLTDRRTLLKMALLGLLTGGRPGSSIARPFPSRRDEDIRAAAATSNLFSSDLQRKLAADSGNLFFSPASISVALAMTAAGAEGVTREEMLKVLHAGEDPNTWLRGMGGLSQLLNTSGTGHTLQMANRLWGQNGFAFRADFLLRLEEEFDAPLGQLDFAGAAEPSRQTINDWVAEQTRDRIQDLLPEGSITELTRLVLTNAIYFKADWQTAFDKKLTQEQPFSCADGTQVNVPLMNQLKDFPYMEDQSVQMLELPYKSGALSLIIVLPKAKRGLPAIEKQLTADKLAGWSNQLKSQKVNVWLPKFKLETQFSLTSVLQELGMPRAFGNTAEFGGMSTAAPLRISDVVHKAFVELDEQGTEAAAATGVIMDTRAAPIEREPVVFRADHPFLFLIRHRGSGAILFSGRLSQPQ